MFIQKKTNILFNFLFLVIITFILTIKCDEDVKEISTEEDLEAVMGTLYLNNNCTYHEDYSSLCKTGPKDPGNNGFWSSCDLADCYISISVRKLVINNKNRPVDTLSVLTHISGDATIQIRYRKDPSVLPTTLYTLYKSPGWSESSKLLLSDLDGINENAEILIRMRSAGDTEIDILDKMFFTYKDEPSTIIPTTIAASTIAPSTIAPPTMAPSTIAPSTIVPSTISPSTIIPSTVVPSTVLPSTVWDEVVTEISTEQDLEVFMGTPHMNNCTYQENYSSLCKYGPGDPGNNGFWSSCDLPDCYISISVRKLERDKNRPVHTLKVLAHISGGAQIQIRYRKDSSAADSIIQPMLNHLPEWSMSSIFELGDLDGINENAEILVRLRSNPTISYETEIIDKLIFTFQEDIQTTVEIPQSTLPSLPSTTPLTEPPVEAPERILDVISDLTDGWINIDCAYQARHSDFSRCPMNVTICGGQENGLGFWSSCERPSCTMMFDLKRYPTAFYPTSITLRTFIAVEASLGVRVLDKNGNHIIGIISGMNSWGDIRFDLTHLEFDLEAIIFLELKSSLNINSTDLIDKVTIRFI